MRRFVAAAFTLLVLGCGDNTGPGPGGRPDAALRIVRQDTLAPPLLATQVTLWAKVEDGREVRIHYQGATPADTGEEFLRFEVPGDGLLRRPDGTSFQVGDSILITITVLDPDRFLFGFEPAGLQFNPDHPARLKVHYYQGEHDFDEDGDEDVEDDAIEQILDLWHREGPGALWFKMGAVKFEELDEIGANILSFSEYAVAW